MFFCSLCGCRADQHAVDRRWQAEEAARRAAEAAAAQRRAAAAAAASASAAAASSAARRAEMEAYRELGLPLGADAKTVARAYKRLALQLHPDKVAQAQGGRGGGSGGGGGAAEAEARRERFLRVAAAYRLLSGSAG